MIKSELLFFVALLPPLPIQNAATAIKQEFADRFDSCHAFKSPPHITLQPPFQWLPERLDELHRSLSDFTHSHGSIPVKLHGFSAFAPRVIYIHVDRSEAIRTLHRSLIEHLETTIGLANPTEKSRPYVPHMTVAFRDLTTQNFKAAWDEFQERSFEGEFVAEQLTLLVHTGQRWTIAREFPLQRREEEN